VDKGQRPEIIGGRRLFSPLNACRSLSQKATHILSMTRCLGTDLCLLSIDFAQEPIEPLSRMHAGTATRSISTLATYNNSAAKSATNPPTPPAAVAPTARAPLVLDAVAAEPVAVPVPLLLGDPDVVEEGPPEEVAFEDELVSAMKTPPMMPAGFSTSTSVLALLMKASTVSFWGLWVGLVSVYNL
jgi:hypothetical protein